jgi:hypothetical protein
MAYLRIEIDRGAGWQVRAEGEVGEVSDDQITDALAAYAIKYPHRAYVDGVLFAEAQPKEISHPVSDDA